MSDEILLLEQAIPEQNAKSSTIKPPDSSVVVNALLKLEKASKHTAPNYSLAELIGTWNLRLITGTQKTRKRAGAVLGAGKYIPQLIKIQLTYQAEQPTSNSGQVINSVTIAFLQLSLTGPIKFMPQKNILAFDFTYLKVSIWGINLYQGYFQAGLSRETEFPRKKLKYQVFFTYFLIKDNFIAARGKGGGLALWSRAKS
jgi:hypothetical protein